jgi:hypothetical protein
MRPVPLNTRACLSAVRVKWNAHEIKPAVLILDKGDGGAVGGKDRLEDSVLYLRETHSVLFYVVEGVNIRDSDGCVDLPRVRAATHVERTSNERR